MGELRVHLSPLMRSTGLRLSWPGHPGSVEAELAAASSIVVLVSADLLASEEFFEVEFPIILERAKAGAPIVPIILRPCDWKNTLLANFQALPRDGRPITRWKNRDDAWTSVLGELKNLLARNEVKGPRRQLLLHRIRLENIRCFEKLDIELETEGAPASLLLLVGENSSGKSTLLRSIALGLCNLSDATALLKQMQGGLIRHQATQGRIELEIRDQENGQILSIQTLLTRNESSNEEVVQEKQTQPPSFPWQDLFACAYGTGRTHQATSSYDRYSLHQALLSLFDDVSLQNPELILLRQDPYVREQLETRVLQVLMLEDSDFAFSYTPSGAQLHTPWGDQAPRTLSDGYRSTTQWLLDFLSWAIYAGRLRNGDPIGGMLLLDEIEQHLHPRWQRHILQQLSRQFPGTQIFTSTHTPLVAAAAADVEGALLVRLEADSQGKVTAKRVEREEIVGLRADQMLAQVFGLYTSRSPGSQDAVSRFAELLGKTSPTPEEEQELETLRGELHAGLGSGETELQRKVEEAVGKALQGLLAKVKPEMLDVETKRQLRDLFDRV